MFDPILRVVIIRFFPILERHLDIYLPIPRDPPVIIINEFLELVCYS